MASKNFPLNYSLDLEIEAIKRLRSFIPELPQECRVFRKLKGASTLLCLDFVDCPRELSRSMEQFGLLAIVSYHLGLAESLIFMIDQQIIGWTTITENT